MSLQAKTKLEHLSGSLYIRLPVSVVIDSKFPFKHIVNQHSFRPFNKKIILKQRGNKCELCSSQNMLQVHHKNRKRYDNSEINLQVLCKNCHKIEHKTKYKDNSYLLIKISNKSLVVTNV